MSRSLAGIEGNCALDHFQRFDMSASLLQQHAAKMQGIEMIRGTREQFPVQDIRAGQPAL